MSIVQKMVETLELVGDRYVEHMFVQQNSVVPMYVQLKVVLCMGAQQTYCRRDSMYLGNVYATPSELNQANCPVDFCKQLFCLTFVPPDCPPNDGCGEQTCSRYVCSVH